MPARNQSIIRRDINRLKETLERNMEKSPAFGVLLPMVASAADTVNTAWQSFQNAAVTGDKERLERDQAIDKILKWIQVWRPLLMLTVPGASSNIRSLPPTGPTPDDVIRVVEDMVSFIQNNAGAESFRGAALDNLGTQLEEARKETAEATAALPAEAAARQAYADACESANTILVRGLEIVRATFGKKSKEYKQFIARSSKEEEDKIDSESAVGE